MTVIGTISTMMVLGPQTNTIESIKLKFDKGTKPTFPSSRKISPLLVQCRGVVLWPLNRQNFTIRSESVQHDSNKIWHTGKLWWQMTSKEAWFQSRPIF